MRLRVLGCGDAFGSGGRFQTCFHIQSGGESLLLDCGASSLIAIKAARLDPDDIGFVFITHLHGDHFGGLVFLLREATLRSARTRPLIIAGPPTIGERLSQALEAFFPSGSAPPKTFELTFVELQPGIDTAVGPVIVRAFEADHHSGAPSYSLRLSLDGRVVAYTGDTLWVENLIALGADADLLICEAYTWRKRRGRHLDYATLLRELPRIRSKRVLLTHLSEDMLSHVQEVDLPIAHDGLELEL